MPIYHAPQTTVRAHEPHRLPSLSPRRGTPDLTARVAWDEGDRPMPAGGVDPWQLVRVPGLLPEVIRRLTPRAGLDLTVRLADAMELLHPLLDHPERLQETHQLPCRAEVFASIESAPWGLIEHSVLEAVRDESAVAPLTEALAERLGLTGFLAAPAPVLSLALRHDPTVEETPTLRSRASARGPSAGDGAVHPENRRAAVAAARKARRQARSLLGRVRAWFGRSRQEADRRAWFRSLAGRPLAEQLWACRPTARLLLDDAVRAWVRQALLLAAADPRDGLKEWELHWRHRGV